MEGVVTLPFISFGYLKVSVFVLCSCFLFLLVLIELIIYLIVEILTYREGKNSRFVLQVPVKTFAFRRLKKNHNQFWVPIKNLLD